MVVISDNFERRISPIITDIAAIIATVGFIGLAIFQLLLVLKFPLGKAAWSGKYQILPSGLRLASFFSALIFIFVAVSVLEKVELITVFNNRAFVTWVVWIFTGFLGLNTLSNFFLGGKLEKHWMTPITLILGLICLFISLTGRVGTL